MNNLKSILLILAISLFALQSCQNNEPIIASQPDATESIALRTVLNQLKADNDITGRSAYTDDEFCFDFVYPFQLEYNTGTVVTVENFQGLIQILIEETPNQYIVGIVMPFDIELLDGTLVTITNEQDFIDVLEDCDFDVWDDDDVIAEECFEFVYPFEMIDGSGNTVTISSEEDLIDFFESQDPNYYEGLFVYPITVIISNGNEVILNSVYDFLELTDDCEEDCNCPEIYEPVCVIVDPATGEIEEFTNSCHALCEGYTPNDFVTCDGIDDCNIYDLEVAVEDCIDTETYSIILDFEYTNNPTDSFDIILGNEDTYTTYLLADLPLTLTIPSEPYYNFLEVILSTTCSSDTEWDAPNCSDDSDFMDYVGECFDFIYPFNIEFNNQLITIESAAILNQYFNASVNAEIEFPIQVVDLTTQDIFTINDMEELEDFIQEHCQ